MRQVGAMVANLQSGLKEKLSLYLKQQPPVDVKNVHGFSLKAGCMQSIFLSNNLIHAYVSQWMITEACKLFTEIPLKNPTSWSTMISGYVHARSLRSAVVLFGQMRACEGGGHEGWRCLPDKVAHASILKGCSIMDDLRTGVQLHGSALKLGLDSDSFIMCTLIDMYGNCSEIEDSWKIFEKNSGTDAVTWTTMITSLSNQGQQQLRDAAFLIFKKMVRIGVWPVDVTFVSLVKIFDEPFKIKQAMQVQCCMLKFGVKVDNILGSALINMYGKCGGINEVVRLALRMKQKDVISWTSLLLSYVRNGLHICAIHILREMIEEKVPIDSFVMASILGVFTACKQLKLGKEVHGFALRSGSIQDVSINNALITLYGRCGKTRRAEIIFQIMEKRDSICWTTLLTCYVKNGYGEKTVFLFYQMMQDGLRPHVFDFTGAIRACSGMGFLSMGEQIHSLVNKMGLSCSLSIGNALINMYGKCGDIDAATEVFNSMNARDTISWNAIIACFSEHGFWLETTILFYQMQREGMCPDDFTFLGILVSCSHASLVAEGQQYFKSMNTIYGLEPKMEHYACMVDLLGRAGKFDDALEFINTMPYIPNHLVWESLLSTCMIHGNVALGKMAAENILKTKPQDLSAYIILSNIYASLSMWEERADVLSKMKFQGLKKEPSKSWVEFKGQIHVFFPDDKTHPLSYLIYWKLGKLKSKMDEYGHVPNTTLVLHDVSQEEKKISLLHHSEKLALAFALIITPRETPIRIMQNLRCCKDCHSSMKLISRMEGRYIILRDTKMFHHFVNGMCSCGDYW